MSCTQIKILCNWTFAHLISRQLLPLKQRYKFQSTVALYAVVRLQQFKRHWEVTNFLALHIPEVLRSDVIKVLFGWGTDEADAGIKPWPKAIISGGQVKLITILFVCLFSCLWAYTFIVHAIGDSLVVLPRWLRYIQVSLCTIMHYVKSNNKLVTKFNLLNCEDFDSELNIFGSRIVVQTRQGIWRCYLVL